MKQKKKIVPKRATQFAPNALRAEQNSIKPELSGPCKPQWCEFFSGRKFPLSELWFPIFPMRPVRVSSLSSEQKWK
jgi:hypothetical protein